MADAIDPGVFAREVLRRDVPVALHFVDAPSRWDNALDRIADELGGGLMIGRIDIASNPALAQQWNAVGPLLVILKDGAEVGRRTLLDADAQQLSDWLHGFAVHGRGCACHPN